MEQSNKKQRADKAPVEKYWKQTLRKILVGERESGRSDEIKSMNRFDLSFEQCVVFVGACSGVSAPG